MHSAKMPPNAWARPVATQNLNNVVQREERDMAPHCLNQSVGPAPCSPLIRGFLGGNRTREAAALQRACRPIG